MKAYMSTDSIAADFLVTRDDADEYAVSEARRILSETEPGSRGDSKTWWGSVAYRYILGAPYATRRDPAYGALAEALAAFVADGERA